MKKLLPLLLLCLVVLTGLSGCGRGDTALDPAAPVTLSMWHVYGEQADSPMNRLVAEFNETVGLERGVVIDVTVVSNASEISAKLLSAQADTPGEPDFPDLFFCHTANAAALGADTLLDWNDYFTPEEQAGYVEAFLDEGRIGDRLTVFPVSKSTHLLFLNGTRFARFSADTGVTAEDLATWEGFFRAAQLYCDWSGGQPFCALDFPLRAAELSALSLGRDLPMTGGWYDFTDDTLHQAWLPFARAMVRGHITISDLYANTQVMTGETLAGLGSSAAVLYYNDTVTYPDNTSEPMDLMVLPMPRSEGGDRLITQAGVGLCALRTDEKKAEAASLFAHWFTEAQRNLDFVAQTGYMPVNRASFEAIDHYDFADPRCARLHHTLRSVWADSTGVTEPSASGYYQRVDQVYTQLRAFLPECPDRLRSGETAEDLAEETWAFFRSVR